MQFLPDQRLYQRSEECLQFLRELVPEPSRPADPRVRFYPDWIGAVSAKLSFAIKSFLATQDPERAELWVWLDAKDGYAGGANSPFLRPLWPFIHVRPFDAESE